jgi:hypothetical protein
MDNNSPSNSSIYSSFISPSNNSFNSHLNSPSNSSIYSSFISPSDLFLSTSSNSIFIEGSIKNKLSYDDFGDTINTETFEFNTPPSPYNSELFSTSYDSDSNIAMLYDDKISLFSNYEDENISIKSNKSIQVELNITQNKIFDRKSYKKEIAKKNTFLNNQKYQIEFNKLILNKYIITSIDKIILRFI